MLFKCGQDICSSFNITFVWSAQPISGGREDAGGEGGGKRVGRGFGF